MTKEPLTADVSERICEHMNKDHKNAVEALASHYGGCSDPKSAIMIAIYPQTMELDVDGKRLQIPFDHVLKDSSDAHQTLVGMCKALKNST